MQQTRFYPIVAIPDVKPENEPVLLQAQVTTLDNGIKHFVFSEHEENQSPLWEHDRVNFRRELINAITGNGNDLSPNEFRYFEYYPKSKSMCPYEEYAFKKDGQTLQQQGTSHSYTREQFGRLNNPQLSHDIDIQNQQTY